MIEPSIFSLKLSLNDKSVETNQFGKKLLKQLISLEIERFSKDEDKFEFLQEQI